MGPQERLIGSLVLFLYIGEEEKVGGEERLSLSLLLSPPQSCPKSPQSAPKPPQMSPRAAKWAQAVPSGAQEVPRENSNNFTIFPSVSVTTFWHQMWPLTLTFALPYSTLAGFSKIGKIVFFFSVGVSERSLSLDVTLDAHFCTILQHFSRFLLESCMKMLILLT